MTTTDETMLLCLATGCGRKQTHGAKLCTADVDNAGQWVAQLDTLYAELSAVPSLQGREPNTGGSGGLAAHRSVGSMDVMAMRDTRSRPRVDADPEGNNVRGVLEVLTYWAGGVRATRGLRRHTRRLAPVRVCGGLEGPVCAGWCGHDTCRAQTMRGTAPEPLTVTTERKVIATNLDWILAQDAAGLFFDDIRALWKTLRRANGHTPPPKRTVLCPACGVPARWTDGAIGCGACGTTTAGLAILRPTTDRSAA